MRYLRIVSLMMLCASPLAAQNILLLNEQCGSTAYYPTALTNLGLTFTETNDDTTFLAALTGGTDWDLVIYDQYSNADAASEAALITYIAGGGRVAIDYWSWNDTLAAAFDADHITNYSAPIPIEEWDPAAPLLNAPNGIPDPLTPTDDTCGIDGARFEPLAGGVAVSGYTGAPAANEAAIIIGNSGRTVLFGGILGLFNGDTDTDGKADGLEMAENIVVFLLGGVTFDVTALFNADVIVNNGTGTIDPTQVSIDDPSNNWAFPTQAVADVQCPGDPAGLPNDGFFPADANHPDVQLAYDNDDDGDNARRSVNATDSFVIDVPDMMYDEIHLIATSGNGDALLTVTLTYTDTTTDVVNVTIPDWFDVPTAPVYYLIDGLDRVQATSPFTCEDVDDAAIFGVMIGADGTKSLASVTVERTDDTGVFSFFGATGVVVGQAITNADLSVTKEGSSIAQPGGELRYLITVTNAGPDAATDVVLTDVLPAGTTFESITEPAGFDCTTPLVGETGTVTCTAATMPVGTAEFTLVLRVNQDVADGTTIENTVTVTTTSVDPDPANNAGTTAAQIVPAGIPTVSEWGLLAMMMALAAFGALRLRS